MFVLPLIEKNIGVIHYINVSQLTSLTCDRIMKYDIKDFNVCVTSSGLWRASGTINDCKVSQILHGDRLTTKDAREALIACYIYPKKLR